jgi:hypothetical protein
LTHALGWDTSKDRELLNLAQEQFDVFLTIDRGLEFQQNLSRLQLGVIVARVPKNQLAYYRGENVADLGSKKIIQARIQLAPV